MSSFISVPAEALDVMLKKHGFKSTTQYQEVVYTRISTRNSNVIFKVYTSIRTGQSVVRAAGRDAIRVCVVYDGQFHGHHKCFGIGKFKPVFRVHSVQSVLQRLRERLCEAAQRANTWINENPHMSPDTHMNPVVNRAMDPEEWEYLAEEAEAIGREWIIQKNKFTVLEKQQEEAGFLSDPDFRDFCSDAPPPYGEP